MSKSESMSIATLPIECPASCRVCQPPPPSNTGTSVAISAIRLTLHWRVEGRMNRHVLEISTYVFRVLRRLAPLSISCSAEKPGSTQRIVVDDDVYSEIRSEE